ncbi:exodeoxyribonuclease I [Tibeticola sp.]|uniref:exodeoxyribonuclease I n=1 Tax=Tibeticola sp. TaxID=2005368 RepID=UPI002582B3A5|nr:exodeoxyribonuclease I [Tibeticola sp.]MCI4440213.1 exodeoxyribonuclease I [Tibeticola sp.]
MTTHINPAAPRSLGTHTFLWHDYETFGTDVRRDRPAQFAAIRTDAALQELGEPLMLYCQPAPDYLPDPDACLVTGITPQQCWANGLPEARFAERIHGAFAQPGTIGVGYNSIRFDDEVTRFLLWRNLIDPYAREWQNECGRWDLLDVVRATWSLRPEGIEWPHNGDGRPSFRLEHLSAANGLVHEAAHDALSDVRATIALARLLRARQPRLFDFCFALHRKERVAAEIGLPCTPREARPFIHISGMFAPERGCLAIMWPLATHPNNRNELIAWDLAYDPSELASLDAEAIRARLFTRAEALPEGVARLPIKSVHLNKSPVVIGNLKVLTPAVRERWGIDLEQQLAHAVMARHLPDLSAIWAEVFSRPEPTEPVDVELDLYGGFLSNADRRRLEQLRALAPAGLANARMGFDDPRLDELVFRWRARNWPETLDDEGRARWQALRHARLIDGQGGARTLAQLQERLDLLVDEAMEREDERAEAILNALAEWADYVTADLG